MEILVGELARSTICWGVRTAIASSMSIEK
jgi:hypothetical protein